MIFTLNCIDGNRRWCIGQMYTVPEYIQNEVKRIKTARTEKKIQHKNTRKNTTKQTNKQTSKKKTTSRESSLTFSNWRVGLEILDIGTYLKTKTDS